ncbi:S26 family signal peptidase [Micromonospora olivasterospora]|uniref:Signal peptidase I n=1 Tax=Micromonospora olivasterospora TaxID=1880 RepID=A0A562IHA1_MICOL|nr:S26 family signal peptidase [Micromonospora olivasterospora]TWH70397.1 signal peptidase I [Micromonospora olivasterospora]
MDDVPARPGTSAPERVPALGHPGPPPAPDQVVRDRGRTAAGRAPLTPALVVGLLAGSAAVPLAATGTAWALGFALLAAALGACLGAVALVARRLVAVTVRGASMQPAFHDGDRVLVRRTATPAVGQVVVVEQPAPDGRWRRSPLPASAGPAAVAGRRWMIKRVAAVPGDAVPPVPALREHVGERVPPGRLVLLGDNAPASLDSRQLGYFPLDRTLGTVRRRLRPTA